MNRKMFWVLLITLFVGGFSMTGCKKKGTAPTDVMAQARRSVNAGDLERCAKKEFEKAKSLLAKAEKAVDEKRYDDAKEFAQQAKEQAKHARDVALANPKCQPKETEDDTTEDDTQNDQSAEAHDYKMVHFSFDSSSLSAKARSILQGHAKALMNNPDTDIRIEGNCSDEGTPEYNLALGNRRAQSVKKFLVNYGIDPSRISTISYGEERPIGVGAVNRRAEFDIR